MIPALSRGIKCQPGLSVRQPLAAPPADFALCSALLASLSLPPGSLAGRVWASPALGTVHPTREAWPGVARKVEQLWSVFLLLLLLLLLLLPSARCTRRFPSRVPAGLCPQDVTPWAPVEQPCPARGGWKAARSCRSCRGDSPRGRRGGLGGGWVPREDSGAGWALGSTARGCPWRGSSRRGPRDV